MLDLTATSSFNPHERILQAFLIRLKVLENASVNLRRIGDAAMAHAYYADHCVGNPRTQINLLLCLDDTMSYVSKVVAPHWNETYFITRAVQFGCSAFIDEMWSLGVKKLWDDGGMPWLQYAIAPDNWLRFQPISLKVVRVLFQVRSKAKQENQGIDGMAACARRTMETSSRSKS